MADRLFVVQPAGSRVSLLSRACDSLDDDRILGSLPTKFRVIFDVAVVLRASGLAPDQWVKDVRAFLGGDGSPPSAPGDRGRCRSCGAEVLWCRTEAGKLTPLNVRPEKRIVVDHETARVVDTYLPHWASCPNAEAHRRGKEGSGS